jgi:hypothetical protein
MLWAAGVVAEPVVVAPIAAGAQVITANPAANPPDQARRDDMSRT